MAIVRTHIVSRNEILSEEHDSCSNLDDYDERCEQTILKNQKKISNNSSALGLDIYIENVIWNFDRYNIPEFS